MSTAEPGIAKTEQFPHLSRAPITEAVLEVRARAEAPWEEGQLREALALRLTEYPRILNRRRMQQEMRINPAKAEHVVSDLGWTGLEFQTSNGKQVARFDRNAFSFARLRPYQRWQKFEAEALRLWGVHVAIAEPTEVQRIGLRFINQIRLPAGRIDLDDYLVGGPHQPKTLAMNSHGFFHQDMLGVPGTEFRCNVIRTVQAPESPGLGPTLVLDIDVFTVNSAVPNEAHLRERLADMRYLKNTLFFGSITPKTKEFLL